jgi:hypothetical protein
MAEQLAGHCLLLEPTNSLASVDSVSPPQYSALQDRQGDYRTQDTAAAAAATMAS